MLLEGTTFKDRSIAVLTPTRKFIHCQVVASWQELQWPLNAPHKGVICKGREVADAYNALFGAVLNDEEMSKFTYVLTLEDDNLPPPNAVLKLLHVLEHSDYDAVSGLYHTKSAPSVPLVLGDIRKPDDFTAQPVTQGVVEVNAIPMGCALWRLQLFRSMPAPWFKTEGASHDIYFARNARAAGHRFAVDLDLRVGHMDTETEVIY